MEKITGIKKYEVDEKLTIQDFYKLLNNVTDNHEFDIEDLLHVLEVSAKGEVYYKDDLNNPILKRLQEKMKEIQATKEATKAPVGKK